MLPLATWTDASPSCAAAMGRGTSSATRCPIPSRAPSWSRSPTPTCAAATCTGGAARTSSPSAGGRMGHEMAGTVLALGKGVETDSTGQPLHEGDRIIYNYFFPCGRCVACLRAAPECCPNKKRPGGGVPGTYPYFVAGFAEYYYLLPGHVCVKVPDDLPDAVVAPINCALAQVIQALDSGDFRQGDTLVVQGAGGLGLNLIAAARDVGASQDHRRRRHPRPAPARQGLRRRPHHRHPRLPDPRRPHRRRPRADQRAGRHARGRRGGRARGRRRRHPDARSGRHVPRGRLDRARLRLPARSAGSLPARAAVHRLLPVRHAPVAARAQLRPAHARARAVGPRRSRTRSRWTGSTRPSSAPNGSVGSPPRP